MTMSAAAVVRLSHHRVSMPMGFEGYRHRYRQSGNIAECEVKATQVFLQRMRFMLALLAVLRD
jgi:hypothetical protein